MKARKHHHQKLSLQARQLLEQGRLDEALDLAGKAAKKDPANPDVQFLLAAIHARRQDFPRVAEHCSKVVALQPGNALAHYNLGLALQNMGQLEPAATAYRKAIQLQPDNPSPQINLTAVLLDQGQIAPALASAEAALAMAPARPAAHIARARVLLLDGQAREAQDALLQAQQRFGNHPDISLQLARCHQALGETDPYRSQVEALTRNAPGHAPAWLERGQMEQEAGNYADAVRHYEQAARLNPDPKTLFNLAHCLYAADQVEAARRLYHELLDKDPHNPLVHNNLGRLYERLGQLENAERHLRRAVELQPGRAVPHCNLGRVLYGRGDYAAARDEYDRAIAADPDYFEGHFGRGQALCELGEPGEAISAFRKALECKPDLNEARYYIASLGGEDSDEADRHDYVAGLFDQYADKFDNELVNKLKYSTPEHLYNTVCAALGTDVRDRDILDLGCGTGLCAPLFRPHARHLAGVDLSSRMIDKARERNLYDDLAVADVTAFMRDRPQGYDLVLAADVFVYIGELADTFAASWSALRPGGYFAFSTETCPGEGYRIRGSGRHAHSQHYIQALAASSGFTAIDHSDCDLRLEYGKPVAGTVYLFQRHEPE